MVQRIQADENGDILISHDAFEGLRPNASYDVKAS